MTGFFMGVYIGVYERFGSGDEDTNGRRFEQVRNYDPALEFSFGNAIRNGFLGRSNRSSKDCDWRVYASSAIA